MQTTLAKIYRELNSLVLKATGEFTAFKSHKVGMLLCWSTGLLVLALWPTVASAHAELVRSDPSDLCPASQQTASLPAGSTCSSGNILAKPPAAIHLWFSEQVQTVRHGITVISPSGKRVEQEPIQSDGFEISIAVNATESGTYRVNWQVISGDTHPVTGRFAFSVGFASLQVQEITNPQLGQVSAQGLGLQVLAHWLHFAGYAFAFGSIFFQLFVIRPVHFEKVEIAQRLQHRTGQLVNLGIVMLVLAEPLALFGQTGSLAASQIFDPDLIGDTLSSSFGRVLAQRLGAAVLLWVIMGIARQEVVAANYVALGLGVLLALVDGQASHAVSSGPLLPGLSANTVHLTAMGVWVGGLVALARTWHLIDTTKNRAEIVNRFGRLAAIALLWLVASGLVMSYLHLARLSDLLETDYGKTLLLKLIFLGLAVGTASVSLLRPHAKRQRWWLIELVVLFGLLGLAGLLISLPPPV